MAQAPIELRNFMRRATMDDVRAGINPLPQRVRGPNGADMVDMFLPPILQFRYRYRSKEGDTMIDRWSEWADVKFEREGDALPT